MNKMMTISQSIQKISCCVLLATALASCSPDSTITPDIPTTRTLTINCKVGGGIDTRASILYGEKDENGETFIWNKGDEFNSIVIPVNNTESYFTATFTIQDWYDDKNNPSSSVPFLSINFPDNDKDCNCLALYPKNNFTLHEDDSATFTLTSNEATQIRNTAEHLNGKIGMYGFTTVKKTEEPWINFHHLTSLFRFTVMNKNATPCHIHKIEVIAGLERIFGTAWSVKTPTDWTGTTLPQVAYRASIHTLKLNTWTNNSTQQYVTLDVPNSGRDIFDAYMITGPGAELRPGKMIYFRIQVSDPRDGYQKQRVYTSLALDAQAILTANPGAKTFEAGKRYWFDLWLDDELTVGGVTVSPWQIETVTPGNTTPISLTPLTDDNTQAGIFVDYGSDTDATTHNVANARLGAANSWIIPNLWKSDEATPHIVVYSPFNTSATYNGTIDLANGTTDYCYASINNGSTKKKVRELLDTNGKLKIETTDYKHQMCKLTIDFDTLIPTNVTLKNLYTAGKLTLNTGAIASTGSKGTSTPTVVSDSNNMKYEIYVTPQDIDADAELLTATIEGKNYSYFVGETALKLLSGEHHTLTLKRPQAPGTRSAAPGNGAIPRLHGTFTLNNKWK